MKGKRISGYYVEQYGDVLKVFTGQSVDGREQFFYTNACAIDLVCQFRWRVQNGAVTAKDSSNRNLTFHKELYSCCYGYYPGRADHINGVGYDNVVGNLRDVDSYTAALNRNNIGYHYDGFSKSFRVSMSIKGGKVKAETISFKSEEAAAMYRLYLEKVWLKEVLGADYYCYDILKDRRGSEDLLDQERTGVISSGDATYRHILRHNDAWHYLRFGLQEYFRENGISKPKWGIDAEGFLTDAKTGRRLSPCSERKGTIYASAEEEEEEEEEIDLFA